MAELVEFIFVLLGNIVKLFKETNLFNGVSFFTFLVAIFIMSIAIGVLLIKFGSLLKGG